MRTGDRHILPILLAVPVGGEPVRRQRHQWPGDRRAALAAIGCGLALTACGASGGGGTGTGTNSSGGYTVALKYATCMRAHGVPNFPDPSPNGGGIDVSPGSGVNPQSPAFATAQQACGKIGGGPGAGHPLPAAQRRQLLALSRCMRAHGVPNFPDPVFPSTGGARIQIAPGSGLDPTSPAFQAASRTCGGPRPGLRFHRPVGAGGGAKAPVASGG